MKGVARPRASSAAVRHTTPMKHTSSLSVGSAVTFPAWQGERHYMVPFTPRAGLPPNLARFAPTVAGMMRGVDVDLDEECYVMIDEAATELGVTYTAVQHRLTNALRALRGALAKKRAA